MKRMLVSWLALVLGVGGAGCYKYVPVELDNVPLGTSVRAHLNSEGQMSLEERTLMERETIKGTLVQRDNGTVYFSVPSQTSESQLGSNLNLRQTVDIPAEHIISVDERRLDKTMTGIAIGGIAAASVTVVYLALRGEPASKTVFPPGPEERIHGGITLLRLPFVIP